MPRRVCSPCPLYVLHANSESPSPIRFAWLGASRLATNRDELKKVAITRQEYQEHGSSWAGRKFAGAL